jgi:hypothetical protein
LCILKSYITFFITGYLIFKLSMNSWDIDCFAIDQWGENCTDFFHALWVPLVVLPSFVLHSRLTICDCLGVKPLIHQSELRTYTQVVPSQEKNSFHFVVLWQLLNVMEWLKLIIEVKYIGIILSSLLMDLVVF